MNEPCNYRFLTENELIRNGDQFLESSGKWRPTFSAGDNVQLHQIGRYRRKSTHMMIISEIGEISFAESN